MTFTTRFAATLCAMLLLGSSARAADGANPSINREFREGADVGVWMGRLEGESREIYQKRIAIADAAGVSPGMAIADVGAGTGLFTILFARKVGPQGRVVAVDISESFLAAIGKRAADEGLANVTTTLGTQTDTRLPEGSVDLVFTSDTYHHFEQPTPVLASIHGALKPRGRLIVIDFHRIPGVSPAGRLQHVRASKETVIGEVQAAGFRLAREVGEVGLSQNYYLVFEKI